MADTDKPSPPTSRAIAMFVIVFVALALIAAAAWFAGGSTSDSQRFCSMAGAIAADGRMYGPDPDQACRMVDAEGNPVPGR